MTFQQRNYVWWEKTEEKTAIQLMDEKLFYRVLILWNGGYSTSALWCGVLDLFTLLKVHFIAHIHNGGGGDARWGNKPGLMSLNI